jgi:hypothetical protein
MIFVPLYCLIGLCTAEGTHDGDAHFSIVHALVAGTVITVFVLIWGLLVWEDWRAWTREEARTRKP